MNAVVIIRRASRDDATVCWEVRRAAVMSQCATAYPLDQLEEWTGGKASVAFANAVEERFYVAMVEGRVAGTGTVDLTTGKIDAIFVHPDFMRRRIGAAMVTHLETLARAKGLREVMLDSTLNAAPFYRRLGFEGETIAQYRSPRGLCMDCVPMTKRLAG
jgi:ribosomal protein S18 acetylase RimI-like enzyme